MKYLPLLFVFIGCVRSPATHTIECKESYKTIVQTVCTNATYDWVWSGTSCAKCRVEYKDGTRETRCGPFLPGDKVFVNKCEKVPIDKDRDET